MKPGHPWHSTPFGRVARFLGSIQLAVPVLVLVAAALAWGTYLESTQNAKVSKATVYGAWWFIALMGLICSSLIFAVITRYPWKRRHVGFITVHAGLLILIVGGFWSLFGRLEGHVTLQEGTSSNILETDEEILELAEFHAGTSTTLANLPAPASPGPINLAGIPARVVALWKNSRPEDYVADDGPTPFRAVEVSFDPAAAKGDWVGDEAISGGAPTVAGVRIRVLPDGASWDPPAPTDQPPTPDFYFTLGDSRVRLGDVGTQAVPGWTIESVQRFARATVAAGKVSEGAGPDNPAVEVVITDAKGSSERHTAFQNFPGMVMSRPLTGDARSGATLAFAAPVSHSESVVLFGTIAQPRVGYVSPDGAGRVVASPASFPAVIDLPGKRLAILNQFSRARVATRFVEAPAASERRPAVVLQLPDSDSPVVIPWKSHQPIPVQGRNLAVGFGPRAVTLPFTIHLNDFRKMDYPGTAMAMAYESDVVISSPDRPDTPCLIHMNSPYAHAPWKVYQSGFVGDNVSVFSVMRDPGLPTTYAGSIILCVGIFITFFSRSLSWGHPGIPAPANAKESTHALPPAPAPPPPPQPLHDRPVHVGAGR
jgi:hypothetical protein